MSLFETSIQSRFDKAVSKVKLKGSERIYDYPYSVRQNAGILKVVYIAKKDIESYLGLCKKVGATPRDCENIANIYKEKRRSRDALIWVDKGLELGKNHPSEAAKIYRALGMRIVKAKKSKYYGIALDHMLKAKKLYSENNCEDEWLSRVEDVRRDHYRKYSFIGDFERIVLGRYPEYLESFEERARKRWEKQLSDTGE